MKTPALEKYLKDWARGVVKESVGLLKAVNKRKKLLPIFIIVMFLLLVVK